MYGLYEARDINKDQSYFLYTLNQKKLAKIIFPLGDYEKEEVKKLAKKLRLPIQQGGESQNICFISEKYPDDFLKKHIKMKPGNIADAKENIIGRHQGLPLYTLGQRRGINIGGNGPYYVVKKDAKNNTLIVSNDKNDAGLYKKETIMERVNWVAKEPELPLKVLIQTRYHNPKVNAIIKLTNNKQLTTNNKRYVVAFDEPQRAVTPGQSVVFYSKKGEVIGGGVIV